MRVLVAHNVSRGRTGGMNRLVGFIHDELVPLGYQVDYFCADDVPTRLRGRAARFAFPLLVYRRALVAARRGRPYDLLNVHEPVAAAVVTWPRPLGSPLVTVTSHGVEQRGWEMALEDGRLGRDGPGWKTRVLYPATVLVQARLGLKCADHVFCVSNQDRDYLTRRLGIPGERITRIYSAADPAYATIAGRRDYARGDRLVFFGTWIARKGTRDLVEAFTALAARYHTMTLTVLGSGMPRATVVEAFPAHVRSKVLWTDASSAPAMAEVLASTDIYVLPSLFEGTPLTLVEAMMTGVPSICTDTSGMHDVIEHGRNGLLVPLRSPASLVGAVERLRNDDRLRERLGRAAHVDARDRYTWPRVARPVREAYERLADSRRRRVLDVRGAS